MSIHTHLINNISFPLQVPVKSWFDDTNDSELLELIPLFEKLSKVDSVYSVLCNSNNPLNNVAKM